MTVKTAPITTATTRRGGEHTTPSPAAPAEMREDGSKKSALMAAAPPVSGVRSAGRFLAFATQPVRVLNGAVSSVLTLLTVGGIWAFLTFAVLPDTRHVTAQTPFGAHSLTVPMSRLPGAIAIAVGLCAILLLIAGTRLQLRADRRRLA
jgi:hypothetical protein